MASLGYTDGLSLDGPGSGACPLTVMGLGVVYRSEEGTVSTPEGEGDQPFVLLLYVPREGSIHLVTYIADRTSEGLLWVGQLEVVVELVESWERTELERGRGGGGALYDGCSLERRQSLKLVRWEEMWPAWAVEMLRSGPFQCRDNYVPESDRPSY